MGKRKGAFIKLELYRVIEINRAINYIENKNSFTITFGLPFNSFNAFLLLRYRNISKS